MTPTSPSALPPSLPRVLGLLWAGYARRPGLLLAVASVPVLLGWFAVLRIRLLTLSDARWLDGRLADGSWLDEPVGQVFWAVMGGSGLPVAYALTAVLVGGRLLGHPVRLRSALALVLRRWPLLVGWWLLFLFGLVLVAGALGLTASFFEEVPSDGPIGLVEVLQGLALLVVLPPLLTRWIALLPVALLDGIGGLEALERTRAPGADRWIAHLLCLLLALALLALPSAAAALVSSTRADGAEGVAFGLAAQGLLLGLLTPLAVLTACAPVLSSRGGADDPRVTPTPRAASARETRERPRFVLGTAALALLTTLPLLGAQAAGEGLGRVPRVSITEASTPIWWEILPDGSGFAAVEAMPQEDESMELTLVTCDFDCSGGTDRQGIGALPGDMVFIAAAAVPLDEDMLVAVAYLPEDRLPERVDPDGPRLSDEELTYATGLDLYRCSDTECGEPRTLDLPDPLNVTARHPYGSDRVSLLDYRMRLTATENGAFAALLYTNTTLWEEIGDEQSTALVACPDPDCGEPRVRELEGVNSPRLALGPDASPVITHTSLETDATHLLVCADPTCAEQRTHALDGPSLPHPNSTGRSATPDVAIGPSGRPHVTGTDASRLTYLYRTCTDPECTAIETVTLLVYDDVPSILRSEGGIFLDEEERPRVFVSGRLVSCADPFCGLAE